LSLGFISTSKKTVTKIFIKMKAEPIGKTIIEASAVRAPARAPQWAMPAAKVCLFAMDLLLAAFCFVAAFVLREGERIFSQWGVWSAEFAPYAALLLFVVPIRVALMKYYDLYRLRGEFSFVEDSLKVFKAVVIGSLLIVAAAFLYRGGFAFRAFSYARGVFVLDFILALVSYSFVRIAVRTAQTIIRRREINLIPTLVVGRGAEASLCIKEMRERRELGYRVIGVIESENKEITDAEFEGVPVIGTLENLHETIRESNASEVIITDTNVPGDLLFDVMMNCGKRRGVEFRIAPSLFNCLPRKTEIDQIGALPVISLFREPLSDVSRFIKRASDIVIASIAIILLAPVWLLIAILIKLESRGPIIFKQERVGMDGRIFLFYKFRTMKVNNDDAVHREYLKQYISGDEETNLGDDEKPVFKLKDDSRVTKIGKRLRRLSLDELPQLLNVIRGDMSVVGPRPPIPYEVEAYQLWHRKRLDMKPGITGLWQVSGRNRLTFDEMVKLDLYYIENWSLLLDLKIILRTLPAMLRGENAY
jgi:exopolysaccharide biosynthesis polyprenyl glycosylphosphotransferase